MNPLKIKGSFSFFFLDEEKTQKRSLRGKKTILLLSPRMKGREKIQCFSLPLR